MSPTYEHRCIGSNVSQATNLNLIVNKSRLTRGRHSRTPTTNVGVSTAKIFFLTQHRVDSKPFLVFLLLDQMHSGEKYDDFKPSLTLN